ncbi:unnamed protein product [Phytophthora lilii]|uniref:Unnamed protein product n=1 Tax=Phytophthora lilii TaxID=2077276 RepID=A0A9W6TVF6_9STRA|nr:unnamed protein product [Phytophthora lilii]
MQWSDQLWKTTPASTIAHCWQKAGLAVPVRGIEEDDAAEGQYDGPEDSNEDEDRKNATAGVGSERTFCTSARIKSFESSQYRDDTLQKLYDESEAAFLKYGEAQMKYDEAKRAIKGNNSKIRKISVEGGNRCHESVQGCLSNQG